MRASADTDAPARTCVRVCVCVCTCSTTDASIWLNQFVKAMRDSEGNLLRNAHLLGFFRRVCKLLYYRILPVFVFDGGAPALKLATLVRPRSVPPYSGSAPLTVWPGREQNARRRKNERSAASLKRTAEKLLTNQLRAHALKTAAYGPRAPSSPTSVAKSLFLFPLPTGHARRWQRQQQQQQHPPRPRRRPTSRLPARPSKQPPRLARQRPHTTMQTRTRAPMRTHPGTPWR
jgi:hypothetical protein